MSTDVAVEMITVVIDGFEVTVPKGTLIIVLQKSLVFRFHDSATTHFWLQLAHAANALSMLKLMAVHFLSHKHHAQFLLNQT